MLTFLAALIYKEQRRANREAHGATTEDNAMFFGWALIVFLLWPLVIFYAFDKYAQRPGWGLLIGTVLCTPVVFFLGLAGYLVAGFIFACIVAVIVFNAVQNAGE